MRRISHPRHRIEALVECREFITFQGSGEQGDRTSRQRGPTQATQQSGVRRAMPDGFAPMREHRGLETVGRAGDRLTGARRARRKIRSRSRSVFIG